MPALLLGGMNQKMCSPLVRLGERLSERRSLPVSQEGGDMSKIEMGKQYRTRDGKEVRLYAVGSGGNYPVHGAVREDGRWASACWTEQGNAFINTKLPADLVEVRPRHKRTAYLHVWRDYAGCLRFSDTASGITPIACVRVDLDFEEGEGL